MKFAMIICFFCTSLIGAQNRFEKHIDATGITTFAIKLTHSSKLKITTTSDSILKLSTIAEGVYQNQVTLIAHQSDTKKINIADVLQPTFDDHNDKLSAHKIHAITTTITLPKNKDVMIEMASGTIMITGDYRHLFVKSDAANSTLKTFTGNAKILAKNGTITAYIKNFNSKTVTNTEKSTHIITEDGNELVFETTLGKVIIIK